MPKTAVIMGPNTLEKLLQTRLDELLDSLHRTDLKGKMRVQIVDANGDRWGHPI